MVSTRGLDTLHPARGLIALRSIFLEFYEP
jgi:hypothetical protein